MADIRADIPADPYAAALTHRLDALHLAGVPITAHLAEAAAEAPLPHEHPAAALWWRLTRHLTTTTEPAGIPAWEPELPNLIGIQATLDLEASPWWPHLATETTKALNHGWSLEQIITNTVDQSGFDDACHALLWRTQQLTTPEPPEVEDPPHPDELPPEGIDQINWDTRQYELAKAARLRLRTEPTTTELELSIAFAEMDRWAAEPHTQERLEQAVEAAAVFYQEQLPGSWTQTYLAERFRTDLTGDPRFRIGHAPDGWTHLVSHLKKLGFTLDEMAAAGLTTTTKAGNTIDRFRNRAIIPIHNQAGIITGFVARRHPDHDDQGPKYLNSPNTALFQKRLTLYGAEHLTPDTTPVLVEGPMDAIAITLAGQGRYIGVAPLGTALTPEQTLQLRHHPGTLIATDADEAGHYAAERAFWLLAAHRMDPRRLCLAAGTDPAQLLRVHGAQSLHVALTNTALQAHIMVQNRTPSTDDDHDRRMIEITAARPPEHWPDTLHMISAENTLLLVSRIHAWTTSPAEGSQAGLQLTRSWREYCPLGHIPDQRLSISDAERPAGKLDLSRVPLPRTADARLLPPAGT